MNKRAEEFSIKYADNKLAIVDKELSETNYHRHTKMGVSIFDGSDIEQAAMDGYEQAEKDMKEWFIQFVRRHYPLNYVGWIKDFERAWEENNG